VTHHLQYPTWDVAWKSQMNNQNTSWKHPQYPHARKTPRQKKNLTPYPGSSFSRICRWTTPSSFAFA
jgi:hypothetical protein